MTGENRRPDQTKLNETLFSRRKRLSGQSNRFVVARSPESLIANAIMSFHFFPGIETDHLTFC
ncbi:MAG: hypothetical protein QMB34_02670, partial [Paracoccaceae bacterium]